MSGIKIVLLPLRIRKTGKFKSGVPLETTGDITE
jgi:hypothetical protein